MKLLWNVMVSASAVSVCLHEKSGSELGYATPRLGDLEGRVQFATAMALRGRKGRRSAAFPAAQAVMMRPAWKRWERVPARAGEGRSVGIKSSSNEKVSRNQASLRELKCKSQNQSEGIRLWRRRRRRALVAELSPDVVSCLRWVEGDLPP